MESKLKPTMYFVRVYEGSCTFEYEYAGLEQAQSHLEWELESGHKASLFAHYFDGRSSWNERIGNRNPK